MKSLVLLVLACIVSNLLYASPAADELRTFYAHYRHETIKPPAKDYLITIGDTAWHDLELNKLHGKLARHAYLLAGQVELFYLLQPLRDKQELAKRHAIMESLLSHNINALDTVVSAFAQESEALLLLLVQQGQGSRQHEIRTHLGIGATLLASGTIGTAVLARFCMNDWRHKLWFSAALRLVTAGSLAYKCTKDVLAELDSVARKRQQAQATLTHLSKAIAHLDAISAALAEVPILNAAFPMFAEWLKREETYPQLQTVLSKLSSPQVKDKLFPDELLAEVQRCQDFLGSMIWAMGRLDAYLSVVRYANAQRQAHRPVTLVSFIEDAVASTPPRPHYALGNLHNPLLARSEGNDFLSGEERVSIFNGPSTCGKSAAIRAIALAHVMAQSIMVVEADYARLLPIHAIGTYFNVGDDIAAGLSGFSAQLLRLGQLKKLVHDTAAKNQALLLAIDEPFKATAASIGERSAHTFVADLLSYTHHNTLLTTHFAGLCNRETFPEPQLIRYFHPEVLVDYTSGKPYYRRTYKILSGVASWWFDPFDNAATAFVRQLEEESEYICPQQGSNSSSTHAVRPTCSEDDSGDSSAAL